MMEEKKKKSNIDGQMEMLELYELDGNVYEDSNGVVKEEKWQI